MEKLKNILLACFIGCIFGTLVYFHRGVISAWINDEPMPQAPWWHFWCKNRKGRDEEELAEEAC